MFSGGWIDSLPTLCWFERVAELSSVHSCVSCKWGSSLFSPLCILLPLPWILWFYVLWWELLLSCFSITTAPGLLRSHCECREVQSRLGNLGSGLKPNQSTSTFSDHQGLMRGQSVGCNYFCIWRCNFRKLPLFQRKDNCPKMDINHEAILVFLLIHVLHLVHCFWQGLCKHSVNTCFVSRGAKCLGHPVESNLFCLRIWKLLTGGGNICSES